VTLGLTLLLAAAAPQAAPVFAARTEAVYVDVFVTDGRQPVAGLTAADFRLQDDGVVRPVELVGIDELPLCVLLVLDTSDSVAGDKLAALKAASQAVVARVGDEVGLLTFGHEIRLRVTPTRDRARLAGAISAIRAGGATALNDAVYAAALLTPSGGRSLVVLFTDGEDNMSWLDLDELRRVLESSSVMLQAVGIVPHARREAVMVGLRETEKIPDEPAHVTRLRQLAESTGGRFWAAGAASQLVDAFVAVLEAMKTRYVLRFEPDEKPRPGVHPLEVKLTRRRGAVHCRRSYDAGPQR
jgi:VWFA-related protein